MNIHNRNFIIFTKHRRLQRLWQFFFTGWGLVMVAALVAGALFSRQILWTPISAVNLNDIVSNQFKMSGASFAGTDTRGRPFQVRAASAHQEYDNPDIIFMDSVVGTIQRTTNGTFVTDRIRARHGRYNRITQTVTLTGNVNVNSSNGDRVITDELVIKL